MTTTETRDPEVVVHYAFDVSDVPDVPKGPWSKTMMVPDRVTFTLDDKGRVGHMTVLGNPRLKGGGVSEKSRGHVYLYGPKDYPDWLNDLVEATRHRQAALDVIVQGWRLER